MILIVSRQNDEGANLVVSWLNFYRRPFFRVTEKSVVKVQLVSQDGENTIIILDIDGVSLDLNDVSFYFYRNSRINFFWDIPEIGDKTEYLLYSEIYRSLKFHYHAVEEVVLNYLEKVPHLNLPKYSSPNKVLQCQLASKFGLLTPKTILSGSKEIVNRSFGQKSILVKTLGYPIYFQTEKKKVVSYASLVKLSDLPQFFPLVIGESLINKGE